MNEHGMTEEALLSTLPRVLAENRQAFALAQVFAAALVRFAEELDALRVYPRIGELPEELLDLLAEDFKVDWWDADYSLAEKRQTLLGSWRVHRTLGTKAAVETALSAVYPDTRVFEWFEYGGEPYHFRLSVNASGEELTGEKHRRVLERVSIFGNLRSVLDEVEYYDASAPAVLSAGASAVGCDITDGASAV